MDSNAIPVEEIRSGHCWIIGSALGGIKSQSLNAIFFQRFTGAGDMKDLTFRKAYAAWSGKRRRNGEAEETLEYFGLSTSNVHALLLDRYQ